MSVEILKGRRSYVITGNSFEVYGAKLTQVSAAFGDRPSLDQIEKALTSKNFKLISITHVDTSSGVLNDIEAIARLVQRVSPKTLIAVDGVCSVGGELIRQEEWGIDVVMTASQKAIGVPPGLALMVVSQRAMEVALTRVSPPTTYFGSFLRWLPIMKKYEARQPSYFATPPVQLIMALNVSLKQLVEESLVPRFERHHHVSDRFKSTLEGWGLKLVCFYLILNLGL
jgi:alanine-glyoxylate transaminase/serine-glyoxylate transaminase/serine-pyruvate transaminase